MNKIAMYLAGSIQKGPESLHEAMKYYRETQYRNDHPMQELLAKSQGLIRRLETLSR